MLAEPTCGADWANEEIRQGQDTGQLRRKAVSHTGAVRIMLEAAPRLERERSQSEALAIPTKLQGRIRSDSW